MPFESGSYGIHFRSIDSPCITANGLDKPLTFEPSDPSKSQPQALKITFNRVLCTAKIQSVVDDFYVSIAGAIDAENEAMITLSMVPQVWNVEEKNGGYSFWVVDSTDRKFDIHIGMSMVTPPIIALGRKLPD